MNFEDAKRLYWESRDKSWAVRTLENDSSGSVDQLFIELLRNAFEVSEDVKIEIVQVYEVRKPVPSMREDVADTLARLLAESEDELLQQHSAMSLRQFRENQQVVELLARVAQDPARDLDVRFNALDALAAHPRSQHCNRVLRNLAKAEDEIGDEARIYLGSKG